MGTVQAKNLSPAFGAEISGVEPRLPLDAETRTALKKLFDERSLLVFRNLDADLPFQTYLSEMLIGNDVSDLDKLPVIDKFFVSNKEAGGAAPFGRLLFHSDLMWVENGCQLLSLYGQRIEQPSIPTLFIDNAQAWNTLPEDLRVRVEGLSAAHCQDATSQRSKTQLENVLVSNFEVKETVTLPIAYRHPRTGRTQLYACPQMTHHIVGLSHQESEDLLGELFDHLYRPEAILTHEWREGDLVMWDNIALQHARPNVTADNALRTLRKTMAPAPRRENSGPRYSQAVAM
jgi:alpha-ketoglutarate-dependent taurine dioxygenase